MTAPEAEARAVGRTRDAARQLLVPFAQAQGARTVEGEDATVQPAMFARRSPRLVVATEQQLQTVDGRADLRDLTPAVGAPVLDFPLLVAADAAPGSRALARALAEHLEGTVGRSLISDEGLRAPSRTASALRPPAAKAIAEAVLLVERSSACRRPCSPSSTPPARWTPTPATGRGWTCWPTRPGSGWGSCPTTPAWACGSSPSTRAARVRTGASSSPSAASTTCASAAPSATPSGSVPPRCPA